MRGAVRHHLRRLRHHLLLSGHVVAHARSQRWIDAVLALFFAGAGLTLLRRAIMEAAGYLATGQ
jgi:hypothetical protein